MVWRKVKAVNESKNMLFESKKKVVYANESLAKVSELRD